MLKVAAIVAAASLLVCCDSESAPPTPAPTSYAPIYFLSGNRLVPEFHPLPAGEAPRELYALLAAGPDTNGLTSSIPKDARLKQVAEQEGPRTEEGRQGGLVLDPGRDFWNASPAVVRARIAQVVNTMASLEVGRVVTLLDGPVPGKVVGVGGRVFRGPVQSTDLGPPRPLLRVGQPAPGSTLGDDVAVRLVSEPDRAVRVAINQGSTVVAEGTVRHGVGALHVGPHKAGPATFTITVQGVVVRFPVRLSS